MDPASSGDASSARGGNRGRGRARSRGASKRPADESPSNAQSTPSKRPRNTSDADQQSTPNANPATSSPVPGLSAKRGRPANFQEASDETYIAAFGPEALQKFDFLTTTKLDDLMVYSPPAEDPTVPNRSQATLDSTARACGVTNRTYHFEDLRNFPHIAANRPAWWNQNWAFKQWPDQEITATVTKDREVQESVAQATRVSGSSLFLPLAATRYITNELVVVVLGFENIESACTFFDTDGE